MLIETNVCIEIRIFCYNLGVKRKTRVNDPERPVFDSIRKPTAPPSRKFGSEVPAEKLRPSLRKTKHKKPIDPEA